MTDIFAASIGINAAPMAVWDALTMPACMTHWMGEPEMQIDVVTDWHVGGPIVVRGVHHVPFENNGTVLQFDKARLLRYTHRSSVSRLADVAESYSILTFSLTPEGDRTQLELTIRNFPTESIQRHLEFYWRTTLTTLKEWVEGPATRI
ncbi:SRPBCC family protein [Dawidia soli]|uniref:SRPBCC domain-containing protein n=1 Tax=Dawidia soli TaxID=2782352 RepID=A0AAP2DB25_9BACT|nr:SRPBCC domain-containing protein [Dawidia soli]MBT1688693.1 SRPBCC domain-containing protein [Dawidia soli]